MRAFARKKGGRCISTFYVNSAAPLLWECKAGHQWNAVPASIRKGTWCPECAGVRPGTIGQLQKIALSRRGACLSPEYRNTATKLKWQCSAGHVWVATPLQIKKGHWCPFCARVAPLTLALLQQMAGRKGGRCLSAVYGNSARPLLWECAAGHQWQTRPSSIRAGHWCPVCAHNQKLKLEVMRDLARERGGMCLSTTYQNGCTPLLWECMFGHRWRARPANVKRSLRRKGSWCPECYNARRTFRRRGSIEAVKHLAVVRKGACLSSEYHGSKVKLLWKCEFGHRWQAAPSYILQGTWCPTCARNRRLSLEQFQDIATQRGGSCLSDAYVNERTRLRWSCVKGHEWEAAPNKVKRGSWCPACARIARRSKWLLQGPRDHNEVHKNRTAREGAKSPSWRCPT